MSGNGTVTGNKRFGGKRGFQCVPGLRWPGQGQVLPVCLTLCCTASSLGLVGPARWGFPSSSKGQKRVTSTLSQSLIVETRWGAGLWDSDVTGQAVTTPYLGSESGLLCGMGSWAKLGSLVRWTGAGLGADG